MHQRDGLMGGVLGPSTAAVQGDMLSDGRNCINMPLMEQNSVFAVFPAAEWAGLVAGDCGGAPLHSSPAPRTSGHAAAAAAGEASLAGGGNIFSDLQQYLHG